jgi:hypothetical protein
MQKLKLENGKLVFVYGGPSHTLTEVQLNGKTWAKVSDGTGTRLERALVIAASELRDIHQKKEPGQWQI